MHKILMIEDDTATRDALERHLSRWGYQVRAAKNFQNILEQLEAFHPHLVLLDISLPFLTDTIGAGRSGAPVKCRFYFCLRQETI